jgi:plasmid stabilization system protein ParE
MGTKFEIVWSKESKLQFDKIIRYLKSEWTEREALKFTQELREFEKVVCLFPELFAESRKKPGFRRAVLTKHNSVVYKIDRKKALIRVYTIFDNRQNPNKLK